MPTKEKSEEEIGWFLEKCFGEKDIERNPKVGTGKADFKIESLDIYVEVHAIKDICSDLLTPVSREKGIVTVEIVDINRKKKLDRIAGKLLRECTQLPEGKKNLIVTKTEGCFVSPDDVLSAIIGDPLPIINREKTVVSVGRRRTAFRTNDELQLVLHRISAVLAYKRICQHGRLSGTMGNNEKNSETPFDSKTFAVFQDLLCKKCQ